MNVRTRHTLRTRVIVTLAIPFVFAAAACGSDDDTDASSSPTAVDETTVGESGPDGAAPADEEPASAGDTAGAGSGTTASAPPPAEQGQAPAAVEFTSFNAATTATCLTVPPEGQSQKPPIVVSWTSANAVEAWYSPSAGDAKDDGYLQIPVNGSNADFGVEALFPCFHESSHTYTITLVGADGQRTSKSWTVTAEEIDNSED